MERHDREDAYSLFQHDHYTVEELARVTMIDHDLIERAAFSGDLRATIVDHHVVRIERDAALDWLNRRLGRG